MVKVVTFIMNDNVDEQDFIDNLNIFCSKVKGLLQYEIVDDE